MDVSLIQGTISGLKTAGDIAKSILDLKSTADIQGKVVELQSTILAAQHSALASQSEQSSLIQRIRDLEEEVARVKAWEETKKRYKLTSPWGGAFVYALKKECGQSEPSHWICTNCYEDGRKSILQQRQDVHNPRDIDIVCPRCNYKLAQTFGNITIEYVT